MKLNNLLNIRKLIKLKLNITIIFLILLTLTFMYYKGDIYLTNLLQNKNIIAQNIEDPFKDLEEIDTEKTQEDLQIKEEKQESTNVVQINSTPKNSVANLSSWHWPTTSNYNITNNYSSYHKALDIYSYDGYSSNIYAANNGTVIEVKGGCSIGDLSCNGKGGNYIIINHNNNNYYTVYMHLNKINVSIGDIVTSGDVIGTMGNTGNVSPVPTSSNPFNGTHLHFCVYIGRPFQGGYEINPMSLY